MPYSKQPPLSDAPKQVLVVSRSALYREGLLALLHVFDDFVACGIAANEKQALHFLQRGRPDLILVDTPDAGTLSRRVRARLLELEISPPILILSDQIVPSRAAAWLESGASGWIHKGAPLAEIVVTLRELVWSALDRSGPTGPNPDRTNRGILQESRVATLDRDRQELLRGVGQGVSTRQLAADRGEAESVTCNRLAETRSRLGLTTERELAVVATALHLARSGLAASVQ